MKLPDGPKTAPLLQMMQWIFQPLAFMDACAQNYGDTFTVRLGSQARPLVFFSNPEAIQQIFTASPKKFDTGRANKVLLPLLGKRSLELLDGKRHERQRQLMMPPFHGERMRTYGQLICDLTEQVVSQWTIGKPFAARTCMQAISFRMMCQVVLGFDDGPRFQQLCQLFDAIFNATTSSPLSSTLLFFQSLQRDFGDWSPWGNFMRQREKLDQLLYAEIRQRREQPEPSQTDVLTLLMSARDEHGQPMTDMYLHSELMTLLFAGHETIATGMAWALYWIHSQPQVLDKLLQELDPLGDAPDPSEIVRLPYLTAVCQETLRIYPVGLITFPRVLRSPLEIMGDSFDSGTVLTGCIYLTHQRQDIYPQPKQFNPERFLEQQFSPYEYLPFGGGGRRCIGAAFAPFAMKLVLAKILSTWQMALIKQPVRPVRRGVTMAPAGGVQMVATSRRLSGVRPHKNFVSVS